MLIFMTKAVFLTKAQSLVLLGFAKEYFHQIWRNLEEIYLALQRKLPKFKYLEKVGFCNFSDKSVKVSSVVHV